MTLIEEAMHVERLSVQDFEHILGTKVAWIRFIERDDHGLVFKLKSGKDGKVKFGIFINSLDSAEEQIITLLHEIAHIHFGISPVLSMTTWKQDEALADGASRKFVKEHKDYICEFYSKMMAGPFKKLVDDQGRGVEEWRPTTQVRQSRLSLNIDNC